MQQLSTAFIDNLRFNANGLIPAISQDWLDGTVLMLAWMNRIALEKTIKSGEVHYWSRSRQEIWHKGATSGHTQILKGLRYDCDADVILLSIKQTGSVACHTGARSCFFSEEIISKQQDSCLSFSPDKSSELFEVIKSRLSKPEEASYTNKLFNEGDNRILKKIGEESAEFIMACKDDEKLSIANEAADLIFHIQVGLAHHGVEWRDVLEVIANRRNAPRRE